METIELDEETVELYYGYMIKDLDRDSATFLKESYESDSDMMECLGRALFNATVLGVLKKAIEGMESDG